MSTLLPIDELTAASLVPIQRPTPEWLYLYSISEGAKVTWQWLWHLAEPVSDALWHNDWTTCAQTVAQLADCMGISPASVRDYLSELQQQRALVPLGTDGERWMLFASPELRMRVASR